ncbi:hypothetical protein MNBD_NITROSPINAE04-1304 [hydrothermal vent metagenome]|uniref:Nitrite reductase (NAD(P)H) n=1 Tax=hydrothermal vent metagenome TaxID=652676 RepID=A0A3B1BUE7_9ZZZZ
MKKYLIIGSGVAGVCAAESIRKLDPDGQITIYNAESFPFYFRAAMAFYIKGAISEEELYAKPASWAKDLRIDLLNEKAVRVNTGDKEVLCESGRVDKYDSLLIATGAWPFKAPWPGAGLDGVVTYRSINCARKTIELVKKDNIKKAVIVGGGILGVEFVEDLHNLGVQTTLLVRGGDILGLLFDQEGGRLIQRQMEADGVRMAFGAELAEITGENGRATGVITKSGEKLEAGLVGIAIGAKPHIEFLEESGIETDRGVIVDGQLKTSIDDVYAAGDVAVRKTGGQFVPCRTWLTAASQGKAAGANMAGAKTDFEEKVFFNASHAYKSIYAVVGAFNAPQGDGYEHIRIETGKGAYNKIIVKEGKVAGGIFIGDIRLAWDVYRAVENEAQVDAKVLSSNASHDKARAIIGGPPSLF